MARAAFRANKIGPQVFADFERELHRRFLDRRWPLNAKLQSLEHHSTTTRRIRSPTTLVRTNIVAAGV
jgi:hypothetical protein